jgi:hypothetical protein
MAKKKLKDAMKLEQCRANERKYIKFERGEDGKYPLWVDVKNKLSEQRGMDKGL